ncbi:MAG: hypothetical protein SFT94_08225 [Pseudanabaenaceae cyanobacterium bins.68]|nr:hypothetical protein [Pseudanabaenaceae cyanobacterium bins.68]
MSNPDIAKQIEQILQKSFYVTLGATSSLLEVVQDSAKLAALLRDWQQELERLTQQLVDKGVITEVEARNFVDRFISRNWSGASSSPAPNSPGTVTTVDTTVVPNNDPQDIQQLADLTKQLADLRAELERLRQ